MRYEPQATNLLTAAGRCAAGMGHSCVDSAHLLLALSEAPGKLGLILRDSGARPELLRPLMEVIYGVGTPDLPLPQGLTVESRCVLRGAAEEARQAGCREIEPMHVLLSLARQGCGGAGEILRFWGVGEDALFTCAVNYLRWEMESPEKSKKEAVVTKLLEQFSEDLIAKASTMEPVIGRDKEIETVIGILCRKNKNNLAL